MLYGSSKSSQLSKLGIDLVLNKNDKREIVRKGYDRIAGEYLADRLNFDHTEELQEFVKVLPENAKVLDVGCGAGVPVTRFLVNSGFDVTGVDF